MKFLALLLACLLTTATFAQIDTEELADRLALKELVDRFSNLADTKDVQAQLDLFTDEAVVMSYRNGELNSTLTGKTEIGQAFSGFLGLFETVFHQNGQQTVEIKGNTANGIAYSTVVLIGESESEKIMTTYGIRYEDQYVKNGNRWLIAKRKSHFLWEKVEQL